MNQFSLQPALMDEASPAHPEASHLSRRLTSHDLSVIETHMVDTCRRERLLSVWSVMCKQAQSDPR